MLKMQCPFCKRNIGASEIFCPYCGQSLKTSSDNTDYTNKYWKEVNALNYANENERLRAIRRSKAEARARTASITRKITVVTVLVAIVVVAISLAIFILKTNSQKKLEFVKADAIGNSYSDTSGSSVMWDGDKRDRVTVTFLNESTLTYTCGNYTLHISSKEGGGYSTSWSQNEIYETNDYEYTFSTSLLGKVTLEFNGKSYEIKLDDDDGTIYSIKFYAD